MSELFKVLFEYLNKTDKMDGTLRAAILRVGDRISCKIKETCHNATAFCES